MQKKSESELPGVGLDVGTMNLVSARETGDPKSPKTVTKNVRDAFLDLDPDAKRALKMSGVSYIVHKGRLIVLGDSALTMANLFKREARRPLSKGVISAGELDAQEILSRLAYHVLADPVIDGEFCYYSVPANPVDEQGQNTFYHQEVFRKILSNLGYSPKPMNEAQAIIFSQCADYTFSGIAVSFGAGMCNICLSYRATTVFSFSIAKGGDWVDTNAGHAVGKTASQMCALKEKGIDLSPTTDDRESEAIMFYLRALIGYCLRGVADEFNKRRGDVDLPDAIPIVVSGGTSKAHGFLDLFKEEFQSLRQQGFPIKVSDIRAATDPLTAVAEGLLVLARDEHSEEKEE